MYICRDGDSDDESSWYYDSADEDDDLFSGIRSDLVQNDSSLMWTTDSHDERKQVSPESITSAAPATNDTQTHVSDAPARRQNSHQEDNTASRFMKAPMDSNTLAHKSQCLKELPNDYAYLDWACLELEDKKNETRPVSYIPSPDGSRLLLDKIADITTSPATSVFMISGINGVRPGRLLAERLYLGSLPGRQMCRAWTLVLDSEIGI